MKIKFLIGETLTALKYIVLLLITVLLVCVAISILLFYLVDKITATNFIIGISASIIVSLFFYIGDFIIRNREVRDEVGVTINKVLNSYSGNKTYASASVAFTDSNMQEIEKAALKLKYTYNYKKLIKCYLLVQHEIINFSSNDELKIAIDNFEKESEIFFK